MKRRVSLRHATSHFLQETRLKNINQLEQKGKQERKKAMLLIVKILTISSMTFKNEKTSPKFWVTFIYLFYFKF